MGWVGGVPCSLEIKNVWYLRDLPWPLFLINEILGAKKRSLSLLILTSWHFLTRAQKFTYRVTNLVEIISVYIAK